MVFSLKSFPKNNSLSFNEGSQFRDTEWLEWYIPAKDLWYEKKLEL